jgi:hypothetical protein
MAELQRDGLGWTDLDHLRWAREDLEQAVTDKNDYAVDRAQEEIDYRLREVERQLEV